MTKLWISLFCILLLAACGGRQSNDDATRSIYYWRTTFRLDSAERAFLRVHHVKKLYVRYFDVTPDDEMHPMPNATIAFADTLPQGVEVVPVVYIVNRFQAGSIDDIADLVFSPYSTDERNARHQGHQGNPNRLRLDHEHAETLFQYAPTYARSLPRA
ncbi:MAG: hypothetical protein ACLTGI_07755 [Hoylesella buccalis]